MSQLDDEFEEWKAWVDSHKDKDGNINLKDNPEFTKYLQRRHMAPTKFLSKELFENLGQTLTFDKPKRFITGREYNEDNCPETD